MYHNTKYTLSANNRKTETISIRCLPETKRKMQNKAEKIGVSISDFALECIETNLKRNSKWSKHQIRTLVEVQEAMNQMMLSLEPEQKEIKNQLIDLSKGEMGLWDF